MRDFNSLSTWLVVNESFPYGIILPFLPEGSSHLSHLPHREHVTLRLWLHAA